MFSTNLYNRFRKNWSTVLMLAFLVVIIVSPGAKAWFLEQLVATGLFKAEIKKESDTNNVTYNAEFDFTTAAGTRATIASLKGKVVFINFWASWCPPCRAEMPSLNNLYKKLQNDDRFIFLFLNEDENKSNALHYLKKNNFALPLYSRSGAIPAEIFSGTLPTTIVLNKEGTVVLRHEGMANYNTDAFIKQLNELL